MRLQLFIIFIIGTLSIASAQTAPKQAPDPRNVVLVGDRFKPLKYDEMTPPQKIMIDHLFAGERGGAGGPFNVLLRSPEAGDLFATFGGAMRFHAALPKDVAETVIIMTGRFWMAQYEWNAHKAAALRNGVSPAIVDAIATGKRPSGMSPEMETAYNFIDELLTTHQVTDATFQAAKDKYGEKGIVDMIGLSGWYSMVSMALDADRYPLPAGVEPELKPLENPLPVAGMGFATSVPGTPAPRNTTSTTNGKTLILKGDRFRPLTYEQMTPEQKNMTDIALAGRGPEADFNIALRSPEAGELLYAVGDKVRVLSPSVKLTEMADSDHGALLGHLSNGMAGPQPDAAIQAGLSADAVKAVGEGTRPSGMRPDEEAVYNFFSELIRTKGVSDATFAALKNQVGERGLVDLMMSAGYHQFTCMFLNVDRTGLNPGQRPALKSLAKPFP